MNNAKALQRPNKPSSSHLCTLLCTRGWGESPRFALEIKIIGMEGRTVEDANDWRSDQNGDGRLYPEKFSIVRDVTGDRDDVWCVINDTGWDGYRECPSYLMSRHYTYEEADKARFLCFP